MSGVVVRPAPLRGVYDDPFWAHVAMRELALQECSGCGYVWFPPGPACPRCLSRTWSWEPVRGTGEVLSWTTFHRSYFPTIPAPHHVVAAALDEGPILLADLVGRVDQLVMGGQVRLVYRPARDEEGNDFMLHGWAVASTPPAPTPPSPHDTRPGAAS